MRNFLSKNVQAIPQSGIRKFFDIAAERKDCLSLGVGEPDFITNREFMQAGIDSLLEGKTQYTANRGLLELREAISKYLLTRYNLSYDPKTELIVTVGASEAIDIALRSVIDPGDEVLIPQPSFVCYAPTVTLASGTPVVVETFEKDKFKLTPENLEKMITDKTKALVFPYPNNPTGAIMEKEDIEKLLPIIKKHDLLVISDEIYSELTYGKNHVSIGSFEGMKERTITINGFSKSFAMTGWRIGYLACPKDMCAAMVKIHQYMIMSAPTTAQYTALKALEVSFDTDYKVVNEMKTEYDMRRRYCVDRLNAMGLHTFEPEGAFYIFPCVKTTGLDGQDFAKDLLEEQNCAVVPGDAFGESGKYFVRISYAYSMEKLKTCLDRIETFCKTYHQ